MDIQAVLVWRTMSASTSTGPALSKTGLKFCGIKNNTHVFQYDSNGFLLQTDKVWFDDGRFPAGFSCELISKGDSNYCYFVKISEEDLCTIQRVSGHVDINYTIVDGKTVIRDMSYYPSSFKGRDCYSLSLLDFAHLLVYHLDEYPDVTIVSLHTGDSDSDSD